MNSEQRALVLGGGLVVGLVLLSRSSKASAATTPAKQNGNGNTKLPTDATKDDERKQLPSDTGLRVDETKVIDAPSTPDATSTPEAAALALFDYAGRLIAAGQGAQLGTSGRPSAYVRAAQRAMVMPAGADDGIYGPETRARGKVLTGKTFPIRTDGSGVAVPVRTIPKPATPSKPSAKIATKPAAKKPAAKVAVPSAPKTPPAPTTVQQTGSRSPKQAAQELYDRATALMKAGKGSTLGTNAAPSAFVHAAQIDMGMREIDGIYGPATRAQGKLVLGKTFPVRK